MATTDPGISASSAAPSAQAKDTDVAHGKDSTAVPAVDPAQVSTESEHTFVPAPAGDSFMRDPHKLVAYIVPFPAPNLSPSSSSSSTTAPPPPLRFVLYTPAPPPLLKPGPDDGRERTAAKVQRKWEEEVRAAHTSSAPLLSFRGLRARVTRGVHWAVGHTTSADLDFLTRIPRDGEVVRGHRHENETKEDKSEREERKEKGDRETARPIKEKGGEQGEGGDAARASMALDSSDSDSDTDAARKHAHKPTEHDSHDHAPDELCRTVKLDSMVLLYPPSMKMTEDELRTEFINSLMRTKSKAQRDAVIATGLLPVTAALDWALVFVGWVFGGALEVDAIWAANSFRGAKTARSVTRRLASTDSSESIALQFVASERAAVLEAYLLGKCIARNPARFSRPHWGIPSEADVMTTIGWQATPHYREENWEDEAWEREQVVSDLQMTMKKAARGWDKWVDRFVKNPEKARAR